MNDNELIQSLYDNILKFIFDEDINVFICGKNSNDPTTIRNQIQNELKKILE